MVVRKFEAATLELALAQVKQAMGPDALILSTAQKKGKWFGHSTIEVAAAMPVKADESFDEDALSEIFPHRRQGDGFSRGDASVTSARPETTESRAARLAYGMGTSQMDAAKKSRAANAQEETRDSQKPSRRPAVASERNEAYFEELGFSSQTAREFVRKILVEFSHADRRDEKFMERERVKLVAAGVKTLASDILERRKSWAVVGAPGVGKTATSVKIALHLKEKNQSVSLVSADRRKLVGEHELASYARILGVPYASAFADKRAKSGIEIIDTPAMGLLQQSLAVELARTCRESSVILVLDAGQRLSELLRVVEQAESLAPVGVFFTRVDMVQGCGVVHDLLKAARLPLLGMSVSANLRNALQFFEPTDLARTLLNVPTSLAANA
jgi:flagellar biosynthesis protein FlhF